jgi:8-oxo-dGTP pyrophosphatase MutT (NUDIX family)
VREETGIEATVLEPLGDVRYTYRRGGRRVRKTVHFFLCEYVRGSTADHDHEVDNARWIALKSARETLSYPGERALIERLLSKTAPGR